MFTTCPKCSLKLVVTAADLRVAQGYVRCGRCSNVFNALAGLSDEQQAVLAREQPSGQAIPSAERAAPVSAQLEPPASGERGPAATEPIPDEALEFDPTTTDVSEVFVEPADDDPTGTFESIVLRSDELGETGETGETGDSGESSETHELEIDLEAVVAIATPQREPEIAAARTPAPHADAGPSTPLEPPAPPSQPAPEAEPSRDAGAEAFAAELAPSPQEHAAPAEDESVGRGQAMVERALKTGSIALGVLLALQIVNHERAQLAAVAWLRAPLTAVYSTLGVPLAPHWNVHAYEVRQLGAVAGPRDPGALTVRASVKNTAQREQPLPLLRVMMQDRFGNRIAARDVPPSAYLPAGSSSRADLGPGQRVDAEIAFADPGPNAVGFEIDACLKLADGRVACANDAAPDR